MLLVCRILVVMVLAALPALAQPSTATADSSARAQEIMKLARAAIADESKLANLKSLSFAGPSRRVLGDFEQQSEVEVEMVMPDKIRRSTSAAPFPGAEFLMVDVINAGKVWFDMTSSMPPGAGGRGGGGGGMQRMVMGPGGGGPNDEAARQAQIRLDLTRLLLGLFAAGPNGVQLEYSLIGEAKAPDGVADVIEVKGPDDKKTRLYVDRNTRRILMLSYRDKDFTSMMRRGGPGGPGGGPGGQGQRGQTNPGQTPGQGQTPQPGTPQPEMTPEEREQRRMAAQKQREQAMANLPEVDFFWRFGDYKSEGGLNLPRLITKSTGDKVNEEWQITKVKVNPNIKPDRFEKKEKQQ